MKKRKGRLRRPLFFLLIVLIIYTIIDNNRILIVEQSIHIENLPEELVGFTILQVSDLHEMEFGKNNKRLIEKINSLSYDVIAFTGDMLKNGDSTNYKPFYELLEGIKDIENAYFVPGNTDTNLYTFYEKLYSEHPFISGIEKRGVKLVESQETVKKNDSTVHFVNLELSIQNQDRSAKTIDARLLAGDPAAEYLTHQKELLKQMSVLDQMTQSDILIGLTHYPVVDGRQDYMRSHDSYRWRDFDLILAGHYHGGQVRLPFFGAFFVPEGWYAWKGFFPPRDRVKGLWKYRGTKQYVSTGLGSSDALSILNFRLFNTPEINLLTLTKEKD